MIDEDKIYDEKEWNQHLHDDEKRALDSGGVVDAAIPSSYSTLGKSALSIAICNIKLDEEETLPYFADAARHYIAKIDAVDEHRDVVDGSVKWNRPTHSYDAIRAAVLADDTDLIEEAIGRTLAMNSDEILDGDPSAAHVLYHVFGLAHYLNTDESKARDWLSKLADLDHGYRKYDGLERGTGRGTRCQRRCVHTGYRIDTRGTSGRVRARTRHSLWLHLDRRVLLSKNWYSDRFRTRPGCTRHIACVVSSRSIVRVAQGEYT